MTTSGSGLALVRATLALAWIALAAAAQAQPYPQKQTVKIVVPFAAGSASDAIGRIMADELRKAMGGGFIVENRPGAVGLIGTEQVVKAAPDGYTLLLTSASTHSVAPWLFKKVPYDPVKDFAHIGRWIELPFMLAVNPEVPAKNVQEFVAYAKAHPGKLAFGYGTSSAQLGAVMLNAMAGINTLAVSYKNHPAALTDVIAGQTQFIVVDLAAGTPHVNAGKLRALAITSARRSDYLPNLPTIAESGFPEYEYATWIGLAAPAGTPREIVDAINAASQKLLANPEVQKRFTALGILVAPNTVTEQEAFVKANLEKLGRQIREAGIQPE